MKYIKLFESDNRFCVYVYLDPRKPGKYNFNEYHFNYEPIYIGKGTEKRTKAHLYLYNKRNTRFYNKLSSIKKEGLEPIIEIIVCSLSEKDAFKQEVELIKLIGKIENGGTLTNLTDGGEGQSGLLKSPETTIKSIDALQKRYSQTQPLRKEEFINTSTKINNNKYDYSLVNYKNANTKVKIICPIHGEFEQTPLAHKNSGQGCPVCGGSKKIELTEFINKANMKFNNKYDYSLVNYINNRTNIKIICPIHGIFEQTPETHLNSNGCSFCSGYRKKNTEEFIENASYIHSNKYDYSNSIYTGVFNKIKIICPIHGEFEQLPKNHLNGQGCKKCAIEKRKVKII